MTTKKEPESMLRPDDPRFVLQPALHHCPRCHCQVLTRVWNHDTGWRELPVPINALRGDVHMCASEDEAAAIAGEAALTITQQPPRKGEMR